MISEKKKISNARYDMEHTVQLKLKLNKEIDKDILERLSDSKNKQGYIKWLIREDIKANADISEIRKNFDKGY